MDDWKEILHSIGMDPEQYALGIELYLRLLGLLYIVVYIPFLFQIKGLYGKQGVCPIARYLAVIRQRLGAKGYYYVPTLFWLSAKDSALVALVWMGIFFGALLAFGFWPPVILLILYIIHLSLTSAGQEFMSFGWEALLLELTFASFLLTATTPYNIFGWLALNFIIIRFMLQAGSSKFLSRDPCWRDMTATCYHYLTQPIPNFQAWYAHKLPRLFQKFSTLAMFFVELIIPLLFFSPPEVRLFCFICMLLLVIAIWQTGNFSYLNHLTFVASFILISNSYLEPFMTLKEAGAVSSWGWYLAVSIAAILLFFLQVINLWNYFFKERWIQVILRWVQPFHISQAHQLFSMMTKQRHEVVIEGSADGVHWKEYLFYYKPSELNRRPRRISPFQPRLDWQAWFLPFQKFEKQYWFQKFLVKLLQDEKTVTRLLRENPFEDKPPLFVRARLYDYEFTSWKEKKETGNWWKRRLVGEYAPPMRLN